MFKVKKGTGKYLIGAVLGLLAGAILYFGQPVKWKGEAIVRIGQILQNQTQNQNSFSIEPLATVIERLKSRAFIQAVAERAKRNEIMSLLNIDEDAGLTIKPTRNSDSLIITVVGSSAELVRISINSIAEELVSKHDALIAAYEADIRKEISMLNSEIDVLSKRLASMLDGQAVARPKPVDERGLVTGFGVMAIQHELDYKLNRSSLLRESISSANIRPTSLIESASVSKRRMFSSVWRACLFGTLLGVFLSVLWVRWGK